MESTLFLTPCWVKYYSTFEGIREVLFEGVKVIAVYQHKWGNPPA